MREHLNGETMRFPTLRQARGLLAALEARAFDIETDPYALMDLLYEHGFVVQGFAWPEWEEGREHSTDLHWIASLDLHTLAKLFTAHARNDRFCENHWLVIARQGVLKAMLHRLAILAA